MAARIVSLGGCLSTLLLGPLSPGRMIGLAGSVADRRIQGKETFVIMNGGKQLTQDLKHHNTLGLDPYGLMTVLGREL